MITVFTNADFVSFDEHEKTYSVMVVNGKEIAYVGYNIPVCYDNEKVVDLNGKAVVPLINDKVYFDFKHSDCRMLAEGESADFAVLSANPLKEKSVNVIAVYVKGKKKL